MPLGAIWVIPLAQPPPSLSPYILRAVLYYTDALGAYRHKATECDEELVADLLNIRGWEVSLSGLDRFIVDGVVSSISCPV